MNERTMDQLNQNEDIAFFRDELCLYPRRATRWRRSVKICYEMMASSKAILEAMQVDFES
jgi:hypothetical protein